MISRNSSLNEIKALIKICLNRLYLKDKFIFDRNNGKGVCERSIVFRLSHYLQNRIRNYYVDCDFNSSFEGFVDAQGNTRGWERQGKPIENQDGTATKRFVDIIVHKRDFNADNDLICFEIKKWNNTNKNSISKDRNNLHVLTSQYGYIYGFHISIHKHKRKTRWTIFQKGNAIEEALVFPNENPNRTRRI